MLSNLLYIDPAAASVLITSITAIVVGCGATAIILWRKFKKGVNKTFHIDENANKEVEDELVITGGTDGDAMEEGAENKEPAPESEQTEEKTEE